MQIKDYSQKQDGFTLIELVTVVIIIIILALIAIPIFISQRQKGWDANVQSDLHNASLAEVVYYHDAGEYTSQINDLFEAGYKQSSKITLEIVYGSGETFCMEAHHSGNPDRIWFVESGSGNPNPLPGRCPDAS
jgi:type IV pilus assembly protein PilA